MEIGNSFMIQRFLNAVWLINPEKLYTMTEVILKKVINNFSELHNLLQLDNKNNNQFDSIQRFKDVAVLNIEGILVPKVSWLDIMYGFISTLELNQQFNLLVEDKSINKIILYFDSPGGESTGIYEFAQSVYQAREKKEIIAFTDIEMCSAAYWIGSAANKIITTPTSLIGSIGTYITLLKEKLEKMDYDIHIIQAGENKLFGSDVTSLTIQELEYFREKVEENYKLFTESISHFRGISVEEVINTKASYYTSINAPLWMYDDLADSNYIFEEV